MDIKLSFQSTQTIQQFKKPKSTFVYNKKLPKDTVSFGKKKITTNQIKKMVERAITESYMRIFLTKDPNGENIFWKMTPETIKYSADILNQTNNTYVLSKALTTKNEKGENILTIVKTAKKLDAITYALKYDPQALSELLSYPTPQKATETLLKNALIKGESKDTMLQSLNKAWFEAINQGTLKKEVAKNLLNENKQYLDKKNSILAYHLNQ